MEFLISVFGRLLGYYVANIFQIKFLRYRGTQTCPIQRLQLSAIFIS